VPSVIAPFRHRRSRFIAPHAAGGKEPLDVAIPQHMVLFECGCHKMNCHAELAKLYIDVVML
jgi:hypothetical protein